LGDGGTVRKLVVATTAGADDAMPARREKAIFGFLGGRRSGKHTTMKMKRKSSKRQERPTTTYDDIIHSSDIGARRYRYRYRYRYSGSQIADYSREIQRHGRACLA
jgi:hypothetical protein